MKVEKINIPNPCPEDVELMDGLGAERYCDQCEKNVHNLSELTQDEADELLAKGKDLCISYKSTHRGEVVFRQEDDPRPSFSQLEGVKKLLSSAAIVAMFISQPALVPIGVAARGVHENAAQIENPTDLLLKVIEVELNFLGLSDHFFPKFPSGANESVVNDVIF